MKWKLSFQNLFASTTMRKLLMTTKTVDGTLKCHPLSKEYFIINLQQETSLKATKWLSWYLSCTTKANEEIKRRRILGIVTPRTQPYTTQKVHWKFIAALSPDPPKKESLFIPDQNELREEAKINGILQMGHIHLVPRRLKRNFRWLLLLAAIAVMIIKRCI